MADTESGLQRRILHITAHPSLVYRVVLYLGGGLFAFLSLFPLYITIVLAVTSTRAVRQVPVVPESVSPAGFVIAIGMVDWLQVLGNTVVIAAVSTLLVLFVGSLAGYVFGRVEFYGRRPLFLLVVALAFFPPEAVAQPVIKLALTPPVLPFVTIPDLYGTRTGIILPTTTMLLPMGVILFTLYFRQIPDNLEAAARVEGATRIESLFYVVLPLSKPALAAVGFIVFIEVYNDYFWTSVLTGGTESVPTVATRLNGLMALPSLTNANLMAAATLISLIPPLVVVLFLTGRFDYWMGLWTGK